MIGLADIERYVGLRHCERTHDCADLAMEIAAGLFGKSLALPQGRPRPQARHAVCSALGVAVDDLARRTDTPQDGDLVLMLDHGQSVPGHVGTYFWLSHEAWVLHTTHVIGFSCLQRVRQLPELGLRVEGFYRWK